MRQEVLDRLGDSSRAYRPDAMNSLIARDAGILEALNIILTAQLSTEEIPQEVEND